MSQTVESVQDVGVRLSVGLQVGNQVRLLPFKKLFLEEISKVFFSDSASRECRTKIRRPNTADT